MIAAAENRILEYQQNIGNNSLLELVTKYINKAAGQLTNFVKPFPADPVKFNQALFTWIKKNIKYNRDGDDLQVIQLPQKLYSTREGDCKSLALFVAAANKAKGIPSGFRFVDYGKTDRVGYSHVYNYFISQGKKIPLDVCINTPFFEYKPIKKIMDAQVITGIPSETIEGKKERKEKRKGKKEKRQERRAKNKAEGKGFFRKAWKAVKKVGMAAPRNAFLAIVAINLKGIASRLSAGLKKDEKKVLDFWKRLGGNPAALQNAVKNGAKKKSLGESHAIAGVYLNEDTAVPIGVVAAGAAAAAPVIIAILAELKKILGNKENPELEALAAQAGAENPERIDSGTQITDSEVEGGGFPPEAFEGDGGGSAKKSSSGSGFEPSPGLILGGLVTLGVVYKLAS